MNHYSLCHVCTNPPGCKTLQRLRSEHGVKKENSNLSAFQVDRKDTEFEDMETWMSNPTPQKRKRKSTSATAESPRVDKKRISNVKSNTCKTSTQDGSFTQTLDPVLIGKEKDLKPFFNDACLEMSKKLRWHTRIGLQDSDTNSSSTYWHNVESNCCVTMKMTTNQKNPSWSKTSSASSQSSVQESMAADTTTTTVTRIRKLILCPKKEVAKKLVQWMGCSRLTYNTALAHIRAGKQHKKTFYWLRNRFVNSCNIPGSRKFLEKTPKHVREGAIKDLAQAYAVNFAVRKKNQYHTFDIQFRKKRDQHSIVIPKDAFKETDKGLVLYPTMLSKDPIKELKMKPKHDCRLSIDRMNRIVLYIPVDVPNTTPHKNHVEDDVVAIDPGVRTFLTTWSPKGEAYKLGDGDYTGVYKKMARLDKLISETAKVSGRSKYRKQQAVHSTRTKLENIQRDMHYQCAHFLTEKYHTIILPVFGAKEMTNRSHRRLNTKTVRSMLGLAHGLFRRRLKDVAERKNVSVVECTEEYTSKTCSCCGWLHPNLGSAKIFACRQCGMKVDRDLQGAFNIFLKNRSENFL